MSKLLEWRVLIYLWVIAKSWRVWGCESEGIKGVYRSSKHRVRGKKTAWNNYYKGKQGWGLMETEGGFWPHHRQGRCLDAHWVLVLAQNTEVGTDAWVPQSAIDGSWLVFGTGLSGSSKLSMDKMRWLEGCQELQWTVGMGLGFIGIDWEVDWGVVDMMLSLIVPEVTRISQHFQKGVMGCNRGPQK